MEQKTTRLFEMQYNYSEDVIPDLVDIHASLSVQHLELINTPYHKSFTAKILSDFEESIRKVLKEKDKILLLIEVKMASAEILPVLTLFNISASDITGFSISASSFLESRSRKYVR